MSVSAIEALKQEYEIGEWAKNSQSENQLQLTLESSEMVNNNSLLFCGSIFIFPPFELKRATIL